MKKNEELNEMLLEIIEMVYGVELLVINKMRKEKYLISPERVHQLFRGMMYDEECSCVMEYENGVIYYHLNNSEDLIAIHFNDVEGMKQIATIRVVNINIIGEKNKSELN